MNGYCTIDLETTTHSSYKRKANPFDPANWIVLAGHKFKDDALPTGERSGNANGQQYDWLARLLRSAPALLIGANIKFDLLHLVKHAPNYETYMTWVAGGGNVWDVQLAEYLLDGQAQGSHMLSLDELAARYGADLKVDEVKKLWEAGVPTEEIDPDLLARYLLGETLPNGQRREGDIGNTEYIFLKQLERARKSGQVKSILLNMGSLLATIEMEKNGMAVNKPLGLELAADLERRLGEAQARMQEYLPADMPPEIEFSWTNRYHLSPLVFGGTIKYERRVPVLDEHGHPAYAQKDEVHAVLSDGSTCEVSQLGAYLAHPCPLVPVVIASGKNKGEVKTKRVKVPDLTRPKSRMEDFNFQLWGFTAPEPSWASSTPGLYSVAEDVIDALGNRNIPFLKDLASVKKMDKDLGTYFIRRDEKKGVDVGMLTLVQPDGLIHHSLNHTSTVTGRFSSSNPNLQNIPKGNKSAVKTVFESRFPGGVIIQSDFSSLEIYIQAILTHCKNLIQDLKDGIDLHCMRLALKEHMDYAEVFALCKGDKYSEEWDYKRTGAKVFSFQRAYGAGAKMIAASTGMNIEEVEALILAEQQRYPEVDTYFEKRTEEIKRNRRPTARMLPHPQLPAVMCQLGISRVSTPDNKLYTYNESPSPEYLARKGTFQSFSPTEVKNYEVQGEGGEWMKAAMWLMVREFYRRGNFGGQALLVNTVHDASYADSTEAVKHQVAAVLHACMEGASDFMEWYFQWPLPLPVPSDTVWGTNMGEENPFKGEEFKALAAEERAGLRARYMSNYQPSYLKGNA